MPYSRSHHLHPQRIQRWLRYHGNKSLKGQQADPVGKIVSELMSVASKPPRRSNPEKFYQRTYYDTRIRHVVDAEYAQLRAEALASGQPMPVHIAISNRVTKALYASETAAFKATLASELEADYQQRLAKHKLLTGATKTLSTAEEYHRYVADSTCRGMC